MNGYEKGDVMRTDATIDKRQVRCPNASTIGFGKWKAQVGDLVLFDEGVGRTRLGRMIGRVHYAPACGETPVIRDFLLVMRVGEMLDHTFERWVDPVRVQRVEAIRGQGSMLGWFLGEGIMKTPIDEVRKVRG